MKKLHLEKGFLVPANWNQCNHGSGKEFTSGKLETLIALTKAFMYNVNFQLVLCLKVMKLSCEIVFLSLSNVVLGDK